MLSIQDMPKEILILIIKNIAQEKENDFIKEVIKLDEYYKKKHTGLYKRWNPASNRYKARAVHTRGIRLISRIIPISNLIHEKNKLLFMIQLMNKQANNKIEQKLFKLEAALINCVSDKYNLYSSNTRPYRLSLMSSNGYYASINFQTINNACDFIMRIKRIERIEMTTQEYSSVMNNLRQWIKGDTDCDLTIDGYSLHWNYYKN